MSALYLNIVNKQRGKKYYETYLRTDCQAIFYDDVWILLFLKIVKKI